MPTLRQVQSLEDPAVDFMWHMDILNVPGLPNINNLYIREVDIPQKNLGTQTRFRAGHYVHFPKYADISQMTIHFYEPYNFKFTQYLDQWTNQIVDNDGNFDVVSAYVGSAVLRLYDITGKQQLEVSIKSIFPIQRNNFSLNWTNHKEFNTTASFVINDVSISRQANSFGYTPNQNFPNSTSIIGPR